MWFWLSLGALLFWSGSDLFSKIGCRSAADKYSHLKMAVAVGVVMGLHACYEIFVQGVEMSMHVMIAYLPVSFLYILSMIIGYLGLRYIELSISSPICNSSGAVAAIMSFIAFGMDEISPLALVAVALVSAGVIFLGITESREDEELRRLRQDKANFHYAKSALAIALPVIYCLLDAAGTFADNIILQTLDEDSANCAYELTFLAVGIVCLIYLLIKKQPFRRSDEAPKYAGAVCETIGQFFYIYAIADQEHFSFSAPIIASYCVVSAVWAAIFLKEKLSAKHYASLALVVAGIVILGILDI